MNIYRISQTDVSGWDTYYSAIVKANTAEDAANMHPSGGTLLREDNDGTWPTDPKLVTATLIGITIADTQPGVILASFNAR